MRNLYLLLAFLLLTVSAMADEYTVSNIRTTKASGAKLAVGQTMTFTFDYTKPDGPVKIAFVPFDDVGDELRNCVLEKKSVVTNSGEASVSMTFTSNDGNVDAIWVEFRNGAGTLMKRIYKNIQFEIVDCIVDNISINRGVSSMLAVNEEVEVSFDFFKNTNSATVSFQPYSNGQPCQSVSYSAAMYDGDSGSGTATFEINSHQMVNQLRVVMGDRDDQGAVYYERFINVDYRVFPYAFYQINVASPIQLAVNEDVPFSYKYLKTDGELKCAFRLYYQDAIVQNQLVPDYFITSTYRGDRNDSFTLSADGKVDEVKLMFIDASNQIVYSKSWPVDIIFGTPTAIDDELIDDQVKIYPNPCVDYFTIEAGEELSYELYDLTGSLLLSGKASGLSTNVDVCGIPSGTYLVKIRTGGELEVKKLILK